ncbi:MAG TPA: serine/threonine-protein kinase, partial [Terracidiphilus sp.]
MEELQQSMCEQLRKDDEFALYRDRHPSAPGSTSVLLLVPALRHPSIDTVNKLGQEYSLRNDLDPEWAVRPLELSEYRGQVALVLEDHGGETLDRLAQERMETPEFLRVAIGLAKALGGLHKKGFVHRDVKPANVLVDAVGNIRLMGFGITSRLPCERQAAASVQLVAGTLPYMAPEQTGRMNRSVDSRTDLYSLGVTLYELMTASLPFEASDPVEWMHAHIARQPVTPYERSKEIPVAVSTIIMKLLAKNADERYQTAAGAESDLRRCLAEWEAQNRIDPFVLGQQDTPDRLLIPEKLYGRESEIATLQAAFDRATAGCDPELVLVSGYSGVGKSSIVSELRKS